MTNISYNNWDAMSDDYLVSFIGEFVKHHRIEQNKTQSTLANDAGISRSTLSILERGGSVTVATLIQVLRVLDQLQIMDAFAINRQKSPILLAQAEKNERRRASAKKKTNLNEDIDW